MKKIKTAIELLMRSNMKSENTLNVNAIKNYQKELLFGFLIAKQEKIAKMQKKFLYKNS